VSAAFDLQAHYLSLDGAGAVAHHDGGDSFWSTVDTRTDLLATLVSCFDQGADWPHWEMHPAGEEILVLLEGEMTMILDDGRDERRVQLLAKQACVVPRGVWHRALVPRPSMLLAITYGEGTQHRPVA
jgi:mannose-6-phosphate isomerase-like protein (cupin superfamily)